LLRALAILLVVVYHAGLFGFFLPFDAQRFGWIGVDLFFVLSGYLIGGQLLGKAARGENLDVPAFYWRRALRILPAYLVIVLLYWLMPGAAREFSRMPPLWRFLTFTQNLGLRGGTAFSHAWSLCIEFQFYLVLPLLLLLLVRRVRRTSVALILPVGILVWCIFIRGAVAHAISVRYGHAFGPWQQWVYYPTYSRLDGLTIGVSLAAIENFRPRWWNGLLQQATWLWLPAVAALVLALFWAENGLTVVSSSLGFSLVAAACGAFLICALSPRLPFSKRAIPGASFLATIAYSVYLTHKLPIHWIEQAVAGRSLPAVVSYLLAMSFALLIGFLLFFVVERPFLRLRERKKATLPKKVGWNRQNSGTAASVDR
jgi:peptidoglycan/LPS O-acetylase OafA/YrhL